VFVRPVSREGVVVFRADNPLNILPFFHASGVRMDDFPVKALAGRGNRQASVHVSRQTDRGDTVRTQGLLGSYFRGGPLGGDPKSWLSCSADPEPG